VRQVKVRLQKPHVNRTLRTDAFFAYRIFTRCLPSCNKLSIC